MEIAFLFYSKFIHPEPFKVNASFKTNIFDTYVGACARACVCLVAVQT